MNTIKEVRSEILKYFNPQNIEPEENRHELSPNAEYRLDISVYRQNDPSRNWSISSLTIINLKTKTVFFNLLCEHDFSPTAWVLQNNILYLVCCEALGGQTVIDLTNKIINSHYSDDDNFMWQKFYISPDKLKLAVIGCYWACPPLLKIYDFNRPMLLPLNILFEMPLSGDFPEIIWTTEESFLIIDGDIEMAYHLPK